ncbi:alpha/beta hydrolase [Actinocrispum sp. NPDC049592]|uniref:alpha/beta hydrolase n=1 Tax=Actinocrispum sp. NPDC049592 TaxID=3154835 RepID=UPI00341BB0B8
MTPTYVFVHGSSSNSFTWAPLQRELALRGHRSLAVDLPGHGFGASFPVAYQAPQDLEAFAKAPGSVLGTDAAVEHVVDVVRRVAEHGSVVLVGHSRGGLTLTGVGNAIPELVDRIVYISAWCCVDLTVGEYATEPENATSALAATVGILAGNPAELGLLRMNWRTADPALLAALKTALLDDGTEQEFLAYLNTLEPDESLDAGTHRADAATWGRIPRTYIRLTKDLSMPLALQDRFIREADALTPDNPFEVHSLDSSHVRFLMYPQEAAEILSRSPGR